MSSPSGQMFSSSFGQGVILTESTQRRGIGHLFVTGKNPVLTGKHAKMTGFSRHLTGKFKNSVCDNRKYRHLNWYYSKTSEMAGSYYRQLVME